MTTVDDKRRRLRRRYVESMPSKIAEMRAARGALLRDEPGARGVIQHLAHKLVGSGASYGFPKITIDARRVELGDPEDVLKYVDALLSTLGCAATERAELGQRLLVIEDDLDAARMIESALDGLYAEVHIAATALAAQALLSELGFDLICLDVFLPDADGREVLAKIKAEPRTERIPVVVITAAGGASRARKDCLSFGVEQFIEKPVDDETIRIAVRTTAERHMRWRDEAQTDGLTGLKSRAGLAQALKGVVSLQERAQLDVSLALLDLDRFKVVNDRHGHLVGDDVLRSVGALLEEQLRAHDIAARWGGEEFLVVLPNTSPGAACDLLRRINEQLSQMTFGSELTNVTFSAGVAEMSRGFDEALLEADRLLYGAKALGRGQTLHREDRLPTVQRALIVDDDPDARAAIEQTLVEMGLENESCGTAEEALALADAKPFQLILLDWELPGMNGDELLRTLRRTTARHVPIVILTARGDLATVESAFADGADDYLEKPFRSRELAARVGRLLGRRPHGLAPSDG